MSPFKSTVSPKFSIDLGRGKYPSRCAELRNILFYSKELPSDLYTQMNISYTNYRQILFRLHRSGFIKKISKDGINGYQLSTSGKRSVFLPDSMKYRDQIRDEDDRHHDLKRRNRKRQFAYLYVLLDRIGVPYETFRKPSLEAVDVYDCKVYFFTALDLKKLLDAEATCFMGSRLLGFLIGKGNVIPVYRTNRQIRTFGIHETLVPMFLQRYFHVLADTAILFCDDEEAAVNIYRQIVENSDYDPKKGINTAQYNYFYVLSSDDNCLSRLNDLYADHTEAERRIIERYGIDTSEYDSSGKYRLKVGSGFIGNSQVLVIAGNANAVTLKYFIRNAQLRDNVSYIICQARDANLLRGITEDVPIEIVVI